MTWLIVIAVFGSVGWQAYRAGEKAKRRQHLELMLRKYRVNAPVDVAWGGKDVAA